MRRALSLLLNTVGYKTAAFASPKEFLDKFKPNTGGCLVLDIRMPGMSDLGLSERTVEIHRAKVMEKMRARSVAHLVKLQMSLSNDA